MELKGNRIGWVNMDGESLVQIWAYMGTMDNMCVGSIYVDGADYGREKDFDLTVEDIAKYNFQPKPLHSVVKFEEKDNEEEKKIKEELLRVRDLQDVAIKYVMKNE